MINNFKQLNIDDKIINKYLFYKNLKVNRIYSSSKKKIKKLDHYLWWFQKQKKRKSLLLFKENKPIFISTTDHFHFLKKKCVYSGLISCTEETNLFDLMKAIKYQNIYLDKLSNTYCFISIDKKNTVLLHHWKYFGYRQLLKKETLYKNIKKKLNIRAEFNIYLKKKERNDLK